jgi:hypothetical protein
LANSRYVFQQQAMSVPEYQSGEVQQGAVIKGAPEAA